MTEFNFVISNKHLDTNLDLMPGLFGNEKVHILNEKVDMYDILVHCELFSSKSQARKNWTRTDIDVPKGFTDIAKIGKLGHRLTIWNPVGE